MQDVDNQKIENQQTLVSQEKKLINDQIIQLARQITSNATLSKKIVESIFR